MNNYKLFIVVKDRIKSVIRIVKNLPLRGKVGFILWIIGFPIGFTGSVLLLKGKIFWGSFLFLLPIFEGNLGIVLMGTEVLKAIKKEFKRKK